MYLIRNATIGSGVLLLALMILIPGEAVLGYDSAEYKKINSSLSCQCGCGLLVSVCTMDGCMCEGVRQQVGLMLDAGQTEDEIIQAMVSTFGQQILAAPPKSGFNLSAYLLPLFFLVIGAGVLYGIVRRWTPAFLSKDAPAEPDNPAEAEAAEIDSKYRQQISDELKDLDL